MKGQLLTEKCDWWVVNDVPTEMWMDVGELPGEVFEHSRLIAFMKEMMNEGSSSKEFTRTFLKRSNRDVCALRRMRLVQLASLANSARPRLIWIRHGRSYREKGKAKEAGEDNGANPLAPYGGGEGGKVSDQSK